MNKKVTFITLTVVVAIIIFWLVRTNRKKSQAIMDLSQENNDLKSELEDQNEVLLVIKGNEEIDDTTKAKLSDLTNKFQEINPAVANELIEAISLINAKMYGKAVFSLAKIIENLMKDKYQNDTGFSSYMSKQNKKQVQFFHLIEFAKINDDLEKEEYHFVNGLRELRNQEAHCLDNKKALELIKASLMIAIGLILKLAESIFRPGIK